jgi:hypothetical protein
MEIFFDKKKRNGKDPAVVVNGSSIEKLKPRQIQDNSFIQIFPRQIEDSILLIMLVKEICASKVSVEEINAAPKFASSF